LEVHDVPLPVHWPPLVPSIYTGSTGFHQRILTVFYSDICHLQHYEPAVINDQMLEFRCLWRRKGNFKFDGGK
jgi:hypothetical protein